MDDFPVVVLAEEDTHAFRHHRSDVGDLLQLLRIRIHDRVQVAEMSGQGLRRGLTHQGNSQRMQEPGQCRLPAAVNGADQVLRGLVRHALQRGYRFLLEPVQVGNIMNQPCSQQLVHDLVPQSLDIHCPAAGEMADVLLALGAAEQPAAAACDHPVTLVDNIGSAYRTLLWELKWFGAIGSSLLDHRQDLGDDIAGPAQDHGIAFPGIQPVDLVAIVQGGIGHRDAAHEYRRQPRHRCDGPGAPHLDLDAFQHRHFLLGGQLVGQCPARRPGGMSEARLPVHA